MLALHRLPIEAVAKICADPFVARAGHDHRVLAPIDSPAVSHLGAYVHDMLVGAFMVVRASTLEMDVHAMLMRQAIPWCRDLGRLCIDWCFSTPAVMRVTAYVADHLLSVRNFCRRLGFVHEGMRRDACQIGGRLVGVHTYGLTRTDWRA